MTPALTLEPSALSFRSIVQSYRDSRVPRATRLETFEFGLRTLFYYRISAAWHQYLQNSDWRHHPRLFGELMEKVHRPFYDHALTANDKLALLTRSHESLWRVFHKTTVEELIHGGSLTLGMLDTKHHKAYHVELSTNPQFSREGVLVMSLFDDVGRLLTVAFSIDVVGERPQLQIGCLQSSPVEGATRIRQATHELYGLQPRYLLVHILKVWIAHLHLDTIEAIADDRHVYNSLRYRRRKAKIFRSYNEFWSTIGTQAASGNFLIDPEIRRKPIEDYPSRKRSEHRHRQALLDQLQPQIEAFFAHRCLPAPAQAGAASVSVPIRAAA